MAFGSSLELDIVPAKEKGETSEMPTMKIKKESRKPLGTSQNLFLLPKQASKQTPNEKWRPLRLHAWHSLAPRGDQSSTRNEKHRKAFRHATGEIQVLLLLLNYIAALLLGVYYNYTVC